jgi:hypothetical protein
MIDPCGSKERPLGLICFTMRHAWIHIISKTKAVHCLVQMAHGLFLRTMTQIRVA